MIKKNEFVSNIDKYLQSLRYEEKSDNTIRKYHLGLKTFMYYAEDENWIQTMKDGMLEYKKHLEKKYETTTANLYIIALNGYLKYLNKSDLCLKTLKMQEQQTNIENSFTMDEYRKMSMLAKNHKNLDTYYVLLALASTGIRINELQFFTVESLKQQGLDINNKGKIRYLPLTERLCNALLDYCNNKGIKEGYVFYGRNPNKSIDRRTVSKRLKKVAEMAGIDEAKAHPHSLRHLFAKQYMAVVGNITGLKNILGHSNLKSTMIYTNTTNDEKRKDMDKLDFY